jgi:hypothetical protein
MHRNNFKENAPFYEVGYLTNLTSLAFRFALGLWGNYVSRSGLVEKREHASDHIEEEVRLLSSVR